MKRILSCLLTAMLATAASAVLAQETIKIGAPQPMTGPDAPFGDKFKKAYGMAVDEINAKGGVNGRKLEVIIEDHQAKNPMAATVAEKLITQNKVLVLTGGRASGQAIEIASVAQRLKTPYVVDHPSADAITSKGFDFVFRQNPTGSIYPEAFHKFISEVPGAMPKSVAVVYDNSLFGKTIGNANMAFMKSKNIPIVNDEAYPVNTLDFRPIMTKVKASNPDMVLLIAVATTDAILMTRHAKEIGINARAFVGFGGGFGVEDFAKQLGPLSENVFSSAAWAGNPNDPATKEFYNKFKTKYGFLPKEHEVEGYAAIYMIADALTARQAFRQSGSRPRRRAPGAAADRHDDSVRQGQVRQLGRPARRQIHQPEHLFARTFRAWRSGARASCSTSGRSRMPRRTTSSRPDSALVPR